MEVVFFYYICLMNYKKLIIRGISPSQTQTGAYALLLEEEESGIKLPIVIDYYGAQAISLGLEREAAKQLSRPMTHDLFKNFIDASQFVFEYVVIYQIIDGVFFSNIHLKHKITEDSIILDARTSDAVSLAVRYNADIFSTKEVLEEAGILLEIRAIDSEEDIVEMLMEEESLDELKAQLEEAVAKEDFDLAVIIQEKIKRRQKKID